VKWPLGSGGRETKACRGSSKQTPGAIGYVELRMPGRNKMKIASLRNRGGTTSSRPGGDLRRRPRGGEVDAGRFSGYRWSDARAGTPGPSRADLAPGLQGAEGRAKGKRWFNSSNGRFGRPEDEAALDYAALPKPVAERSDKALRRSPPGGNRSTEPGWRPEPAVIRRPGIREGFRGIRLRGLALTVALFAVLLR